MVFGAALVKPCLSLFSITVAATLAIVAIAHREIDEPTFCPKKER